VPIHLKGFDHFIVVKGIVSGRVMIADPAFGNNTMRVDRFQELWKGGIVFIVHPPDEKMIPKRDLTTETRLVPDATVIARQIQMTIPTFTLY
jgi:predicted double-glycine peptidase